MWRFTNALRRQCSLDSSWQIAKNDFQQILSVNDSLFHRAKPDVVVCRSSLSEKNTSIQSYKGLSSSFLDLNYLRYESLATGYHPQKLTNTNIDTFTKGASSNRLFLDMAKRRLQRINQSSTQSTSYSGSVMLKKKSFVSNSQRPGSSAIINPSSISVDFSQKTVRSHSDIALRSHIFNHGSVPIAASRACNSRNPSSSHGSITASRIHRYTQLSILPTSSCTNVLANCSLGKKLWLIYLCVWVYYLVLTQIKSKTNN